MSLSDANIIQENSGTTSATTSHAITLGSATTAGNTLIVILECASAVTAPAAFTADIGLNAGAIGVARAANTVGGETSWTFTTAVSANVSWYVVEMSNLDDDLYDVTTSNSTGSLAAGGTLSTGTTAQNASLSVVSFAAWTGGAGHSWSGYTNGFEEVADVAGTSSSVAVARKFQEGTTSTFSSTATKDTGATTSAAARIVVYRAADSLLAAPLSFIAGFDWGTHGGLGNSGTMSLMQGQLGATGTYGTNYLIQAGSARSSNYGLRVVQSAGTGGVLVGNWSYGNGSLGCNVRVVSATGTPTVLTIDTTTGSTDLKLVYNATNTQFGLQWGAGTIQYQAGTTALNTWVWVDISWDVHSSTYHANWRLETGASTYTSQTSPTDPTGQSATNIQQFALGGYTTSQTVTVDFDDLVISQWKAAYPLGPHTVKLLTVDTGGTPSVSGTTTNFNVFTANGTLAAWNATNARDAVDEVPPTISASSDGVVQVTTAASDYMEFPMANPSLASDEVAGGYRFVGAMWGGTGTGTGNLAVKVSDGTNETVIDPGTTAYDADSLTAASATYPVWRCGMITPPPGGWTKTKGDALVSRIGYSSDATPDMGASAFYIEYARRKAITARQITLEDPMSATVDLRINPYSSASVSYLITNNDATRSVNFNYSISGTPQTPTTVSPSSNQTVSVSADNFGDISDLSLEPQ